MKLTMQEWQALNAAQATISRLALKLNEPEPRPMPKEPDMGAVVKFVHRFEPHGRPYHYAAGRGPNGSWYLTQDGRNALTKFGPKSWRQVVEMADEGTIYVVRSWDCIG